MTADVRYARDVRPDFGGFYMRRLLVSLAAGASVLIAVPALAQTPTTNYPGPTTTTTGSPSSTTNNDGSIPPGGTRTFVDCNFAGGSGATRQLNGANVLGDTADQSGCITTDVRDLGPAENAAASVPVLAAVGAPRLFAQQQTTGSARRVSIDGAVVTGRVGSNTLVIQGTGSNGATRTVTHVFELSGSRLGSGDTARSNTGTRRSALARTGAFVAGSVAVAGVLLGVGFVLVRGGRRRTA